MKKILHILLSRYRFYKKFNSQLQFLSCEILRVPDEPEEKATNAFHAMKNTIRLVLDEVDTERIENFMKLFWFLISRPIIRSTT